MKYSKTLTKEINAFLKAYKEFKGPNGREGTNYKISFIVKTEDLTVDNFNSDKGVFINIFAVMDELGLTPSIEFVKTFHTQLSINTMFWYNQNKKTTDYVLKHYEELGGFNNNVGSRFKKIIMTPKQLGHILMLSVKHNRKLTCHDLNKEQKIPDSILNKYFLPEDVFRHINGNNLPFSYIKKNREFIIKSSNYHIATFVTEDMILRLYSKKEYQDVYITNYGKIRYCNAYMDKEFLMQLLTLGLSELFKNEWKEFLYSFRFHVRNPAFDCDILDKFVENFKDITPRSYFSEVYNSKDVPLNKAICKKYKKELVEFFSGANFWISNSVSTQKFIEKLKKVDINIYKLFLLQKEKVELLDFTNNKGFKDSLFASSPLSVFPMIPVFDEHMSLKYEEKLYSAGILKKYFEDKKCLKNKYVQASEKRIKTIDKELKVLTNKIGV